MMKPRLLPFLCLMMLGANLSAQVTIKGEVKDAESGEVLPFSNVLAYPMQDGVTANAEGQFELSLTETPDSLQFSFLGYQSLVLPYDRFSDGFWKVRLQPQGVDLEEVTVKEKKGKYVRKGNPAVALIKQVVAHKSGNRLESRDYFQYRKYEKLEVDLTHVEGLFKRGVMKNFRFLQNYADTSEAGTVFLPFFLQESLYSIFFRKKPRSHKTFRDGLKLTLFDDDASEESLALMTNQLYERVNIYDDQLLLFDQYFVGPISAIGVTYYRFYIQDTVEMNGRQAVHLTFLPANKYDLGFIGDLFITADSSYKVLGVKMGILDHINLNFVKNLILEQDFTEVDGMWAPSRELISAEYSFADKLLGFRGKKTTHFYDYQLDEPAPEKYYALPGNFVTGQQESMRSDSFWTANRPVPLEEREKQIYHMVDTLKSVPAFKNTVTAMKIISSGFIEAGPFDIGSLYSFVSTNQVEGLRLKFGLRTNENFSKRVRLKGHIAYGLRDRRWKYSGGIRYAFDEEFSTFPNEYIQFTHESENRFPGQYTAFIGGDNLFLSVATGNADKMLSYDLYRFDYFKEFDGPWSVQLSLNQEERRPVGALRFPYFDEEAEQVLPLERVASTEVRASVIFAPNAEVWEGTYSREYIPNTHPIVTAEYAYAIPGFLNGQYEYHRLRLGIAKRLPIPPFGYTAIEANLGKIWGDRLPYILLHIPEANQTLIQHPRAYNMMRFLEFASDEYLELRVNHYFYGFIFNKIPLLRKLKLREAIGMKMYYGRLSNGNNPQLDPTLVQFTRDEEGRPETFIADEEPYIEAQAGITNILKFGEIYLVRRFTYLDRPDTPDLFGVKGLDVRIGFSVDF